MTEMKMKIVARVLFPVDIDHEFEIEDPDDSCEIHEAIFSMANHILNTSSINGVIEGEVKRIYPPI
jgi:hypothetical protein